MANLSIAIPSAGKKVDGSFQPKGYVAPTPQVDANTVLLLRGGAVVDSSSNNLTVTTTGTVGTGVGIYGDNFAFTKIGRLKVAYNPTSDINFTGDYTVDMLVAFSDTSICGLFSSSNLDRFGVNLIRYSSGKLHIFAGGGQGWHGGGSGLSGTKNNFVNGQVYHIALVRSSGIYYIYIDGVLDITWNDPTNVSTHTTMVVGGAYDSLPQFDHNGSIEMFRVSDNVRWTGNFTPPTSAY